MAEEQVADERLADGLDAGRHGLLPIGLFFGEGDPRLEIGRRHQVVGRHLVREDHQGHDVARLGQVFRRVQAAGQTGHVHAG